MSDGAAVEERRVRRKQAAEAVAPGAENGIAVRAGPRRCHGGRDIEGAAGAE